MVNEKAKQAALVALGELLIDFTPIGRTQQGNSIFEQNPGGAPANVLSAFCKFGGTGCFMGKVGDDFFGHFLKDVLKENRVSPDGLKFTKEAKTTLAFVQLDDAGERSFSFYRNPGADVLFCKEDLDFSLLDSCSVFHFGSLSLTDEPSRNATLSAAEYAKRKGKLISYDPNYRPLLWKSKEDAVVNMKSGLKYADILKVSTEELQLLSDCSGIEEGARKLHDSGIHFIAVTRGSEGSYYYHKSGSGFIPAFTVNAIDTTGAGDVFLGALLYRIHTGCKHLNDLSGNELESMIRFANAAGGLCTEKKGAIPAIPDIEDIDRLLSR